MQRIWRFTRAPTREHHACVHVGIAAQAVRYILRTERLHLRVAPSLRVGPCKFKRGATRILAGGGPPTEMKSMDWDTGKCRDRGSDWERDRNREKDREWDSGGESREAPETCTQIQIQWTWHSCKDLAYEGHRTQIQRTSHSWIIQLPPSIATQNPCTPVSLHPIVMRSSDPPPSSGFHVSMSTGCCSTILPTRSGFSTP